MKDHRGVRGEEDMEVHHQDVDMDLIVIVITITTHLDLVADPDPTTDILNLPLIIDPLQIDIDTLVLDQDHERIGLGEKQVEDLLIHLIVIAHLLDLNIDQHTTYHLMIVEILMKFSCFST